MSARSCRINETRAVMDRPYSALVSLNEVNYGSNL
jgi:hypothetical protein